MTHSIHVENLSKSYGTFRALDNISFEVKPGEIVGFLGPNGAGKTTTMKILTCFMDPSSGQVKVAGFDVQTQSKAARQRIGYLPESVPLYNEMMVFDYLRFIAEVRNIPSDQRRNAIKKVVRLTGLEDKLTININHLSKGYKQRVGLAQAIIHEPEVIILDEPTTGLDPNQIAEIRDLIREIGKEKTVIFSTHILQEVGALCDRIIVLNHGKIIADGTMNSLADTLFPQQEDLIVEFDSHCEKELSLIRDVNVHPLEAHRFRLESADPKHLRKHIYENFSDTLLSLSSYKPTLEDIFKKLTLKKDPEKNDIRDILNEEEE